MKSKILVFPCGSEIGLEIQRSLTWCRNIELFGASSVKSNHGKYVYKNYIEDIPFIDEPDFVPKLNEIVREYNIDFLYPAHDSVVLRLAQNQDAIECNVIGSPAETCQTCRSKLLTYKTFQGKLRIPEIHSDVRQINKFPVFLKPDIGQGSRGIYIANSLAEAEFYLSKDPTLLVTEYLPGAEFTIDCFTDRHGKLRFAGGRKRARTQSGISVDTYPAAKEEFHKFAEVINNALCFRGAWFFQLKENANGDLVLMEIASRIAGGMGLYRNLGVNFPLLSIFDWLGIDVHVKCNSHFIEMDRALQGHFQTNLKYQHVYIDLDDTIIVNDRVNVTMVAFLYQCLNKGIKTHLITCFSGDIHSVLRRHRLDGIFDTIIQLNTVQKKADFIKKPSSIFIDDSFAERFEVKQKLGIPVFAPDAIESLLDGRDM